MIQSYMYGRGNVPLNMFGTDLIEYPPSAY